MPDMILRFKLPEEKAEAEEAARAGEVLAAIGDWLNWCRSVTKYGAADGPRGDRDVLSDDGVPGKLLHGPTVDVARSRLWEYLSDRGVDVESL